MDVHTRLLVLALLLIDGDDAVGEPRDADIEAQDAFRVIAERLDETELENDILAVRERVLLAEALNDEISALTTETLDQA